MRRHLDTKRLRRAALKHVGHGRFHRTVNGRSNRDGTGLRLTVSEDRQRKSVERRNAACTRVLGGSSDHLPTASRRRKKIGQAGLAANLALFARLGVAGGCRDFHWIGLGSKGRA